MTTDRALLELENMLNLFEDHIGYNATVKLSVTSNDIDALRMAVDALKAQKEREDDRR